MRTTLGGWREAAVAPPATIVIGAVAGLDLAWYERRPLLGRRVVVTRARAQASGLSTGSPTSAPARSRCRPSPWSTRRRRCGTGRRRPPGLRSGALRLGGAHLGQRRRAPLCRTSATPGTWPVPPGSPPSGRGPPAALAARGVVADLVPERSVAEGLLGAWPPRCRPAAGRCSCPGRRSPATCCRTGLAAAGWEVDVVEAYRTEAAEPAPDLLDAAAAADAICFTSASTVTNFAAAAGIDRLPPLVASIGPVTSAAARQAGIGVTVEAAEHTIDGLVAALVAAVAPAG